MRFLKWLFGLDYPDPRGWMTFRAEQALQKWPKGSLAVIVASSNGKTYIVTRGGVPSEMTSNIVPEGYYHLLVLTRAVDFPNEDGS